MVPRLAGRREAPAAGGDATGRRDPEGRFSLEVRRVLAGLQPGEVVTYGEVAREAGFAGAARAVGMLLARAGSDLPWWRVVTSTGRLVPGHEREHARQLRAEGVHVVRGATNRLTVRRARPVE
ncbi:MAG: MGMT family protein [Acidimicrobiales bacterium]